MLISRSSLAAGRWDPVAFAHRFEHAHPYPYPRKISLDDELFTRRGSLYFGTAHLLAYDAPYDRYLYPFAVQPISVPR